VGAAIISLSLQLAMQLAPEAEKLWEAIAALRQKGVSEADIIALVEQANTNISALDADTLATLAGVKTT
jgi:hypothetical protein